MVSLLINIWLQVHVMYCKRAARKGCRGLLPNTGLLACHQALAPPPPPKASGRKEGWK